MSNQRREVSPSSLFSSLRYLDSIANVGVKNFPREKSHLPVNEEEGYEGSRVSVLSKCGKFSSNFVCEDDETHRVAKVLDCNREWCGKCRDSAHGKRIARVIPKAKKIEQMAMLTVTFPHDGKLRKKEQFSRTGRLITEALQRRGFKRGFRRWHWFGDSKPGVIPEYHPHIHFLVEARYVSSEKLRELKRAVRAIIGVPNAVIHYQFTDSIPKIFHWIKYITRPTFLEQKWSYDLAEELYNFRNSVSFGKWNDEDKWSLPEEAERWDFLVKIEGKICPVCGGRMIWVGVSPTEELAEKGYAEVYPHIWMCGGSPEMVQNFDLLKKWSRAFGGFDFCDKKALDNFFKVLNSGGVDEVRNREEGARVNHAGRGERPLESLSGRFSCGEFEGKISARERGR